MTKFKTINIYQETPKHSKPNDVTTYCFLRPSFLGGNGLLRAKPIWVEDSTLYRFIDGNNATLKKVWERDYKDTGLTMYEIIEQYKSHVEKCLSDFNFSITDLGIILDVKTKA